MWREQVRKAGIQKVADHMGVTYMAVKKYTRDSFPEPGTRMRSFVAAMFKLLPEDEFIEFLNSLAAEVMGAGSCSMESASSL